MIIIFLALIVSATADPDFYAVKIEKEWRKFKVFTKISECIGVVYYQSAEKRVLFLDGVWKIGKLMKNLDCKTLSSVVEEEYRTVGLEIPEANQDEPWIDIKETDKSGHDTESWIWIEGFNKSVEVTGMKLVGGNEDSSSRNKEDCLRKDRGKEYPGKNILVAFQDLTVSTQCFYDSVDQAELQNGDETIMVHPAGKKLDLILFLIAIIMRTLETTTTTATSTTTTTTTTSTVGENDQLTFIYILLGVVIIISAALFGVVIKIMKKRRETEVAIEDNENYGRAMDFAQYHEDEKNAKIVDTNDYY